jgi:hypothetical protein
MEIFNASVDALVGQRQADIALWFYTVCIKYFVFNFWESGHGLFGIFAKIVVKFSKMQQMYL